MVLVFVGVWETTRYLVRYLRVKVPWPHISTIVCPYVHNALRHSVLHALHVRPIKQDPDHMSDFATRQLCTLIKSTVNLSALCYAHLSRCQAVEFNNGC